MSNETKQFEWTDELVEEYLKEYHNTQGFGIQHFKKSKLQSQDKQVGWEIVAVSNWGGQIAYVNTIPTRGAKIHSVKRLSDGEVFTIGDKCTLSVNPIVGFEIVGDQMKVLTEARGNWQWLSSISHIKEIQPSSIDRIEVTTCGHANWNEPNGGAFIFKTNKPIRYNDFPSEKIKQAIEAVLNGDTVVEDDIVGLLRDCVSSTWGNPSLDRTQELFDKFLLDRKLVNPTLKDVNKTVTKLVNEILLDKKYFQSEVDTIRREAWDAAREMPDGTQLRRYVKWLTFNEWYKSLSTPTAQPKEEDKPVLFTTEDGVEVKHGQNYWHIVSDWTPQMETAQEFGREEYQLSSLLRFSTKEAAKQYILENKPCLSANDIKWWLEKYFDYPNGINVSQLNELVKQKLNQQ